MKLAIIMPAYNEEKRIGNTLETYLRYFNNLKKQKKQEKFDYEILVIINNTTDRTTQIVKSLSKKNKHLKSIITNKGGKGLAVLTGFKDALKRKSDFIGFVDADMATLPEDFHNLLKKINNCDGTIASRYVEGAILKPKPTKKRYFVSRVYNLLIRTLFFLPYKDTQCGAKLFTRRALESSLPKIGMTKWAFDLDLIYNIRKRGFKIKEIPTTWADKEYSTINFISSGPLMALAVVRLRILNSPVRRFIRIYDKIVSKVINIKI